MVMGLTCKIWEVHKLVRVVVHDPTARKVERDLELENGRMSAVSLMIVI